MVIKMRLHGTTFFFMLLYSFIATVIVAVIFGFHIKNAMKAIMKIDRKSKAKKILFLSLIVLPVLLIVISFIINVFAPVNYIEDQGNPEQLEALLGNRIEIPPYGLMATVAAIFAAGLLLLTFFHRYTIIVQKAINSIFTRIYNA